LASHSECRFQKKKNNNQKTVKCRFVNPAKPKFTLKRKVLALEKLALKCYFDIIAVFGYTLKCEEKMWKETFFVTGQTSDCLCSNGKPMVMPLARYRSYKQVWIKSVHNFAEQTSIVKSGLYPVS